MSAEAFHIEVICVSSSTVWHVQIEASLQLVRIWVFVKPSYVNKGDRKTSNQFLSRLVLLLEEIRCLLKTFPRDILYRKLCAACCAVISEALASLLITHFSFVSSHLLPFPVCSSIILNIWLSASPNLNTPY